MASSQERPVVMSLLPSEVSVTDGCGCVSGQQATSDGSPARPGMTSQGKKTSLL